MSRARPNPPLNPKVLPDLAEEFRARAMKLGLGPSALLAVLIWNDSARPNRSLSLIEPSQKLARIPLKCSIRATHLMLARNRARSRRMTLNAYLEALIGEFVRSAAADLTIFRRK